ncbi:hypothetical protein GLOIN_2v1771302 [Rhizophagus irregularis DAOM 181602=DAOM 197198]|uniref:Uncharacterized protein n=1 Tax=Rhizophagus irregularis (strain DAOM 181602 / DAOM 197198 / MUCL 43194) TaxID=747089 RepID=A0A2P4QA14_RHIID|nr:hypothetical protein GLOIN_2v1771302 [Rhizophagus irregularis DAOM 181602=DAOM 197198]POG74466.1 hypothetical protein GLOIN_2v1771302 [Rhizophagus irregularis DAOM 181602=DAOM 197198]CAG8446932.1 13815_t:CDS:2 [Rhizophagus irregularis]|eukprot:XP_025181332.1 hypothetical protein GLOIN_2v1771302 [Rhizophagus irregularis DAOM 181602=DAOM 197198]
MGIDEERVLRLAQEGNRKRVLRARNKNQLQDRQINEPNDNEHIQREDDNRYMHVRSTTSTTISEDDHKVLQKFHQISHVFTKMDHTIWFQTPNNANVGESAHANINCDGRDISLLSGIDSYRNKSDLFQSIQVEQRSASTTISTTLTPITQNSNFHWTNLTLYRHPD